ncbi:MAG: flagellar hook-basal body complex protein [Pirellulaceae bacterium]
MVRRWLTTKTFGLLGVTFCVFAGCNRTGEPLDSNARLESMLESVALKADSAEVEEPEIAGAADAIPSKVMDADEEAAIDPEVVATGLDLSSQVDASDTKATASPATRAILRSAVSCELVREETLANNIANATTIGFKRREVILADVAATEATPPGEVDRTGDTSAVGTLAGGGCRVVGMRIDFSPGLQQSSKQPLDLAIEGEGFFQISLPNGEVGYTRDGRFTLDANGMIALSGNRQACLLEPTIALPDNSTKVVVDSEGGVFVGLPSEEKVFAIGRLQLARFANPTQLAPIGDNLFRSTDDSGIPTLSNPQTYGAGAIRQGRLERSNVDVEVELKRLSACRRRISQLRKLLAEDG